MINPNQNFQNIQINPIDKLGSPGDIGAFNPNLGPINVQQQPIKMINNPNLDNRMMGNIQNIQQGPFQQQRPFQGEMIRNQGGFNPNIPMNVNMGMGQGGMMPGNMMGNIGGPMPMNQQMGMNVQGNIQPNFQGGMMGQMGMQNYSQPILQQSKLTNFLFIFTRTIFE